MMRMIPSMIGNFCARNVLKISAAEATAIARVVPCHGSIVYESGKLIIKMPMSIFVTVNEHPAMPVCQPSTHNQPVI